ncbi:nuclear transport factor 2 family protein [Yersinia enterocolitica]
MIQSISRKEALSFLEYFRRGWETGGWSDSEHYFAKGMSLRSSHKGMINGLEAVISAFAKDTESGSALNLVTSNYYAADDGQGLAMVSAYLYGEICPTVRYNPSAMFGAVVRVTLKIEANAWKIAELLVNISWAEGSTRYFPDWKLPPGEKGWRPGDAPPVLVSELDSPWACIPENKIKSTEVEQIEEAYSRYSWGIDQNDFGQFRTSYTEDAQGLFPPLGPLSGLHSIVGSLKEFRRHWPWMQYYGVPLKITLASDGKTAEMWTGRLIPGQFKNARGEWMYGAHYRIELRKENGLWKFTWSEYVPGWFSQENMPFCN